MEQAQVARPKRRVRRRRGALLGLLTTIGLAVVGCTSTITPPPAPADPTTVFLLREAMHTGVVLPGATPADEYVEFGFGDWSWYALGNESWYHVFATVLWPTQGALGRRTFGATTAAAMPGAAAWAELQPVVIDRERAAALRTRLQQLFDAGSANAVARTDLRFRFVPFDASYWFPQNCADIAAHWFEELGCEVSWRPVRMGLVVAGR